MPEAADDQFRPVLKTAEPAPDETMQVGDAARQGVVHRALDAGIARLLGIELRSVSRQVGHREVLRVGREEGGRPACPVRRSQITRSGAPTFRRKCRRARITVGLETLPRTCRAKRRPSGVTATMLETS